MLRSIHKAAVILAAGFVVSCFARESMADVPLVTDAKGWSLTLDGRLNTFFSFASGQGLPPSIPNYEGVYDYPSPGGTITKTRVRSGFVENVLGFTLKKQLTPNTLVTGRFGTWVGVAVSQSKADIPPLDARELYVKIDAPWGGVLAGRNLSLFGRGAIQLDYDVVHAYGLGSPCAIQVAQGGACGFAGYGILFPAYNAGVVYNTPLAGGFQLSVGAFDPSAVSTASYQRTPYPRFEGEASFEVPKYFKATASGQWQKIGQNNGPLIVDAAGGSFSAEVTLGPVQLGGAGFAGQGLGIYQAMEDSPIFSDSLGIIRHQQGFLGVASLTFGGTKVGGGVGQTQLKKTPGEGTGPINSQVTEFPAKQLGISLGVYQHIADTFVLALEYFRSDITWQDQVNTMTMVGVVTPSQHVNFVNAGITTIF
jgi:Gram-negative porin